MKLENIGEVIAVRRLKLVGDSTKTIVVKMGKPQRMPDTLGDVHYCTYQISGPGIERMFYAAGVDAFQAVELGLKMIGIDLGAITENLKGNFVGSLMSRVA